MYYTFRAFVTLVIQHVCASVLSVAFLALQYFPTLSHKRQDFQESVIEKVYVLIFSAFCLKDSSF
jgi:hypothetical protein